MAPAISIALPVPPPRIDNLLCTLRSIENQNFPREDIQACIGVDGASAASVMREIKKLKFTFDVRCEALGKHYKYARRNAARNKACSLATAPILMVNDCDMLLSENAVSDMVAAHKYWNRNGVVIVTATCLNNIECDVPTWAAVSARYIDGCASLGDVLDKVPHSFKIHDSYGKYYTTDSHKLFREVGHIQENFPSFPAWLWEALGGFDESFVGWGGNKEEFVARIVALRRADVLRLMLLPRVILYHQPHYPSEDRNNSKLCALNKDKYLAIRKIDQTPAWQPMLNNVKHRACLEGMSMLNSSISIICRNPDDTTLEIVRKQLRASSVRYELISDLPGSTVQIKGPMASGMGWYGLACSAAQYGRVMIIDKLTVWPEAITAMDIKKAKIKSTNSMIIMPRIVAAANYVHLFDNFDRIGHAMHALHALLSGRIDINAQKMLVDRVAAPKGPSILIPGKARPNIAVGMLTFNRCKFLKNTFHSLMHSLRPDRFNYHIVISDDHSNDDSADFLRRAAKQYPVEIILNTGRGGVSVQSNRLLSYFDGRVDFGFLANDDLLFRPGWEEIYWRAHQLTGWSHFAFMDIGWEKRISQSLFPLNDLVYDNGVFLVNWRPKRLQGALLTFDQSVIDRVGGFDADRFGLFSHEHVDWTVRNQRAGTAPGDGNWEHGCYDVLGSFRCVSLNLNKYHHAVGQGDIDPNNEAKFNQVAHDASRIKLPLQLSRRSRYEQDGWESVSQNQKHTSPAHRKARQVSTKQPGAV